jgi:hypothetical protein
MVYQVWLMGGLGNQLFQVNYGYKLMSMGHEVRFIDNLIKKTFITRSLLSWNVHPCALDSIMQIKTHTERNLLPIFFARISIFNQWSNFLDCSQLPYDLPKNIFSYFQCQNLQKQVFFKHEIHPLLLEGSRLNNENIVVHLRFGDAPNLNQNISYYNKALTKLGKSKFLVCTDDKVFAKKFLEVSNFSNYIFSSGSLLDDFKLLANAKIVIAAPSTFSFWAIKISNKISEVYMPKEIYTVLGSPSNFAQIHII